MNDPHVAALHYRLVPGPHVDFDSASPLKISEPAFDVEVTREGALFKMKTHFASASDALVVVQPYVDAWIIAAGLDGEPGAFSLEYSHPEIEDRSPAPGIAQAVGLSEGVSLVDVAEAHVRRGAFPSPTQRVFASSPDVEYMYRQYRLYRQGRLPLPHMSYAVCTVLTDRGGVDGAARIFSIEPSIFHKVGDLSAKKGGEDARKAKGRGAILNDAERAWLDAVAKIMVWRAGEVAASASGPHELVTLADLPPL